MYRGVLTSLMNLFIFPVQMRMARKTPAEVQTLMTRALKPLTPLNPPKRIRVADLTFRLARGQIHTTTAPWLILPDKSLPKPKLAREAFPKPPKAAGSKRQKFSVVSITLIDLAALGRWQPHLRTHRFTAP